MEREMEEQSGEVTSPAPLTKGCGIPSIIAPGQKAKVLLWRRVRIWADEDHESEETVPSTRVRKGVNHDIGRWPSERSSGACKSSRRSEGACPWCLTSAITSETSLGRSVGVGKNSPWCRQSRVSSAS